jgi:hypothetical protein
VEYQHRSTGPVLHVVDHHLARSDLHPRKLTRGWRLDEASTAAHRTMNCPMITLIHADCCSAGS